MLKKKIFAVIMYVLACFTVLSACASTAKEETEQSSEKKAKKKDKKKKDKKKEEGSEDTIESEKETEATLEDLGVIRDKEELKAQLVAELDDFLASDFTSAAVSDMYGDEDEKDTVFSNRIEYEDGFLYYTVIDDSKEDEVVYILTDGKVGYVNFGESTVWNKLGKDEALKDGPLTDAAYINYISFMYAALDAGLDCPYASNYHAYYLEANEEAVNSLDLKAIKSKLKNVDKFLEYEEYLAVNEERLKTYNNEQGALRKSYLFEFKNDELFFMELVYNEAGKKLGHSITKRIKPIVQEDTKISYIEKFNKIKSMDTHN